MLLEVLPKGLEKFFFTTSGTEANEAAIKIARMVTGKTKISPAIVLIMARLWPLLRPLAIPGDGLWSPAVKVKA